MKQSICLLVLLISALSTQGTPIHIEIGAGGSLGGLENLPPSISGIGDLVTEIIGSESSSSSEAPVSVPAEVPESSVAAESSSPSVPVELPESSSVAAESPEPSVPAEVPESSSVAAESSEPSVPAEEPESSSAAAESSEPSVPEPESSSAASAEPTSTTERQEESTIPAETSSSTAPSSSTTVSSAPSETTVEVTSEPESSTNSTVPESTEKPKPTTPEWENPNTCLGSCPAVDSYDSVYLVNERCDKFCQCSNGRAIVLSCPEGLHFNRVLNVCDWPVNAKCARLAILT